MPPVSKAQAKWAFENEDKPGKLGAAAKEFVPHGKGSMKALPEKKASNEQKKHMKDVLKSGTK